VYICSFLDPNDLGHLACVSASFGRKVSWRNTVDSAATELRSVVEEAARRWVVARLDEGQTWSGPVQRTWLGRMHELHRLGAIVTARRQALTRDAISNRISTVVGLDCEPPLEMSCMRVHGLHQLKRVYKEYKHLHQFPVQDGIGVAATICGDDLTHWEACIVGQADTPYEGGVFFLDVWLPHDYPCGPPIVRFITPVYHCNIGADGRINVDILHDKWSPGLNVRTVVISLAVFLTDPNPYDGACCAAVGREAAGELCRNDRAAYDETARKWTREHAWPQL
jgi:ubiquitin-protein ligase